MACLDQADAAFSFLYQNVLRLDVAEWPLPACRVRQFSPKTEECDVSWARRFIRFHGMRHPNTRGPPEVEWHLADLAVNGNIAASRQ